MGVEHNFAWQAAAASALGWWQDAGVDTLVAEEARDWLAAPATVTPSGSARASAHAETAQPLALPADIASFTAWRLSDEAPEASWGSPLLPAQGKVGAPLMVLLDMPDQDDVAARQLLTGAAGQLFDRMLAAIGLSREMVYIASVAHARPVAGRLPVADEPMLERIARHHVALAAPKLLLIMGNAASRAILRMDALPARGHLHALNLADGTIAAAVTAVATLHPRLLLERPAAKAESWKDLQMLARELAV